MLVFQVKLFAVARCDAASFYQSYATKHGWPRYSRIFI